MKPIALADTALGQVYAYACGACFHVAGGSSLLGWEDGHQGPHPQLVELSHEQADRCCRCMRCGSPIDRRALRIECKVCRAWSDFTHHWIMVGLVKTRGFKSVEEYCAWFNSDDEDDDVSTEED